jgi:hypothetical protein
VPNERTILQIEVVEQRLNNAGLCVMRVAEPLRSIAETKTQKIDKQRTVPYQARIQRHPQEAGRRR